VTREARDHRGARERRVLAVLRGRWGQVAPRGRRAALGDPDPPARGASEAPAAPPERLAAGAAVAPAALADRGGAPVSL